MRRAKKCSSPMPITVRDVVTCTCCWIITKDMTKNIKLALTIYRDFQQGLLLSVFE